MEEYRAAKARKEKPKKPKKVGEKVSDVVRYYCKQSRMKVLSVTPTGIKKYSGENALCQRINVARALDEDMMAWILEEISAGEDPSASLPQVIHNIICICTSMYRDSFFFFCMHLCTLMFFFFSKLMYFATSLPELKFECTEVF